MATLLLDKFESRLLGTIRSMDTHKRALNADPELDGSSRSHPEHVPQNLRELLSRVTPHGNTKWIGKLFRTYLFAQCHTPRARRALSFHSGTTTWHAALRKGSRWLTGGGTVRAILGCGKISSWKFPLQRGGSRLARAMLGTYRAFVWRSSLLP